LTSGKFAGRVEELFEMLPKPLEWRSFYRHGPNFLVDTAPEAKKIVTAQVVRLKAEG